MGPSQVAGGHLRFYFYGAIEIREGLLRFARVQVGSAVHNGIVILRSPETTAGYQKYGNDQNCQ
jgi:hypothetical protein